MAAIMLNLDNKTKEPPGIEADEKVCYFCDMILPNSLSVEHHIESAHDDVTLCHICDQMFDTRQELKFHKLLTHRVAKVWHNCDHCSETFGSEISLKKHVKTSHTTKTKPSKVKKKYPPSILRKSRINHEKEILTPNSTDEEDPKKVNINMHAPLNNPRKRKGETETTLNSNLDEALPMEKVLKSSKRMIFCNLCFKSFNGDIALKEHKKSVHERKAKIQETSKSMYPCDTCDQVFFDRNSVSNHILQNHSNSSNITKKKTLSKENTIKNDAFENKTNVDGASKFRNATNNKFKPEEDLERSEKLQSLKIIKSEPNQVEAKEVDPAVIENDIKAENSDLTSNEDIDDIVLQPDGQSMCLQCGLEFPSIISGRNHFIRAHKKNNQVIDTAEENFTEKADTIIPPDENIEVLEKSNKKPGMSYVALTALAIQNLPEQKGTRQQIYNWIEESYPYFKTVDKKEKWTAPIRCTLNTNLKIFKKDADTGNFTIDTNSKQYISMMANKDKSWILNSHKLKCSKDTAEVQQEMTTAGPEVAGKTTLEIKQQQSSSNVHSCNQCGANFTNRNNLTRHVKRIHEDQKNGFLKIDFTKNAEINDEDEDLILQPDQSVICGFCGRVFATQTNGRVHVTKKHKSYKFVNHVKPEKIQVEKNVELDQKSENDVVGHQPKNNSIIIEKSTINAMDFDLSIKENAPNMTKNAEITQNSESSVVQDEDLILQPGKSSVICAICGRSFSTKSNGKKHVYKKHKSYNNVEDTVEPPYEDISKFLQISMTTSEQQSPDELEPVNQEENNDEKMENYDFTSNEDIDDIVLQPDGKSLCFQCGLEFPNLIIGKEHYLSIHHQVNLEKKSSNDDPAQFSSAVKDENIEEEKFNSKIDSDSKLDLYSVSWQDSLNDNILLQPDGKAFCQICGIILSNMRIGKRHFSRKHQQNVPHSCQICNRSFKNKESRNQHQRSAHKMSSTGVNDFSTTDQAQLVRISLLKPKAENDDIENPTEIVQNNEEEEENLILQPDESVICAFCGNVFATKSNGRKHINEEHKISQNDKSFKPNQEVDKVIEKDIKTEKNNDFMSNEEIDDIVLQPDGKSLCLQCGLEFANITIGKNHFLSIHQKNMEENFAVENKLKIESDLNEDDEVMHESLLFKQFDGKTNCLKCNKSFCSKTSARRHYASFHTSKIPAKCKICGKVSKNKIARDQHVLDTHKMGIKEYNEIKNTKSPPGLVKVWGNPWGWVNPDGSPRSKNARNCTYCKRVFNPRDNWQYLKDHVDKCQKLCQFTIEGKSCSFCFKNDFTTYGYLLCHIENEHKDNIKLEDFAENDEIKSNVGGIVLNHDYDNTLILQSDKSVICAICSKTFSTLNGGRKHVGRFHKTETEMNENNLTKKHNINTENNKEIQDDEDNDEEAREKRRQINFLRHNFSFQLFESNLQTVYESADQEKKDSSHSSEIQDEQPSGGKDIQTDKMFETNQETEKVNAVIAKNIKIENNDDDVPLDEEKVHNMPTNESNEKNLARSPSPPVKENDSIDTIPSDHEGIENDIKTENNDYTSNDDDIEDVVLQPNGKSLCFQCGVEFPNMITGKEHFISVHLHEKNNLNEDITKNDISGIEKPTINAMDIDINIDEDTPPDVKDTNPKLQISNELSNEKCHTKSPPGRVQVWGKPWGSVNPNGTPISKYARNCTYCKKVFAAKDNKQCLKDHVDKCKKYFQFTTDGKTCSICHKFFDISYGRLLSHIEKEHKEDTKLEENEASEEDGIVYNHQDENLILQPDNSVICVICSKTFATQNGGRKHVGKVHKMGNKKNMKELCSSPGMHNDESIFESNQKMSGDPVIENNIEIENKDDFQSTIEFQNSESRIEPSQEKSEDKVDPVIENVVKTENNDFSSNEEDFDDIVLQPDGKSLCFQCGLEFPNMISGKEHYISVHHHEKNNFKNEMLSGKEEIPNDNKSSFEPNQDKLEQDEPEQDELVIDESNQMEIAQPLIQNSSALALLSLLHSNQLQFNCDQCSQCFQAMSELETHKNIQHGSFTTTCNVCNQEFNSSKNLLIHTGKDHLAESIQYVKKKMLHAN